MLCLALLSRVAVAEEPGDAHLAAGVEAFEHADWLKAQDELDASIAAHPSPRAALYLGNVCIKLGQLTRAVEMLRLAIELDPQSPKRDEIRRLIEIIKSRHTGTLHVTSTPPGAIVRVGTVQSPPRGRTPLDLQLSPGAHRLVAELAGYDTASLDTEVNAEGRADVSFTLEAPGCDLTVASPSPEARGSIDGAAEAPLPIVLRVAPGEHLVKLSAAEHAPSEVRAACKEHQPLHVESALVALPRGQVEVTAAPGLVIYVDGKVVARADRDAESRLELAVGEHRVTVERAHRPPWTTTVVVTSGVPLALTPPREVLIAESGVRVDPAPEEAEVLLDGQVVSARRLLNVTAGRHTLEVRANGYRSFDRRLSLGTGEVAELRVRLTRPKRVGLVVGLAGLALGGVAEGVALYERWNAGRSLAGTAAYARYHDTEIALHAVAGGLAIAGVGSLAIGLSLDRSRADSKVERSVRIGIAAVPYGSALTMAGQF